MGDSIINKPRALIIDDEVDICYLLKGILRHKNIEADYVTSLGEAKEAFETSRPAIIFLDNHLPDGLGVNYIRQLKDEQPDSIVIMITAHDTALDRQVAFKEGVDFFISKPFTRDIILSTLDKIGLKTF